MRDLASDSSKVLSGGDYVIFGQKIDETRFKTWLLDNSLEHFEKRFEEMGISTLYDVMNNLAELKEIEFLDAYHALYSLESNKDNLESYNILHNPSATKLVGAWIWFICKFFFLYSNFSYVFILFCLFYFRFDNQFVTFKKMFDSIYI